MINKNIMRQAQELQAKLAKAQEELGEMVVEVTAGGGVIKVIIDGQQKIRSVKISPEAVNPEDIEMLEDLVMSAINEALEKSRELAASHLGGLTNGFKFPGLF